MEKRPTITGSAGDLVLRLKPAEKGASAEDVRPGGIQCDALRAVVRSVNQTSRGRAALDIARSAPQRAAQLVARFLAVGSYSH